MVARPGSPPRRLIARSLDAVARDLLSSSEVWRVHSVFDRAANLRSAGGELLGLALAPAPDAPATVVVGSDPGDGPLSADVAPGMAGFVDDDMLSIGERLTIDLRNAALWSPSPIKRNADVQVITERIRRAQEIGERYAPTGGLAPLLANLADLLNAADSPEPSPPPSQSGGVTSPRARLLESVGQELARPPLEGWGGGSGDPMIARATEAVRILVRGWRSSDTEQIESGARMLSGLGLGLTPSGDDLLAGLALGLRASLGTLPDEIGIAIESATVHRTTDLAVARVEHAVAGRADAYVDAVLRALLTAEASGLAASVVTLLGYGHTSGVDTLFGLLLGVGLAQE